MDLAPRPLVPADRDLYVERDVDRRIEHWLELRENVLLRVARGAGATSLMNRLVDTHPDAVLINAGRASTADELLYAIAAQMFPRISAGDFAQGLQSMVERVDPLADPRALRELRRRLEQEGRDVTILLDGPVDPSIAHDLFGRYRDATFSVPATWLVVAHDRRTGEYLTPPADVFFAELDEIEDLDEPTASMILDRRKAFDVVQHDEVSKLLEASDKTPRGLLTVARRLVREREQGSYTDLDRAADTQRNLSRAAAMLLAELQGRGPSSATDPILQERLAVPARDLRRQFAELEHAGLVERVPSGRPGPGRPAVTWKLTDLGDSSAIGTRIS
jgi:hypothetical protein